MSREQDAWEEFRQGDQKALQFIFEAYYQKLLNYGHKFTADEYVVQDVIQDLFFKLWLDRKDIGKTSSVKHYLYKSFRRRLLRKLDYAPKILAVTDDDDQFSFDIELSHEHQMISSERLRSLQHRLAVALAAMTPRQREVIQLRYFEEMEFEEIAEIMQLSTKATYKLLHRAIDTLRKQLPKFDYLLLLYLLKISKL